MRSFLVLIGGWTDRSSFFACMHLLSSFIDNLMEGRGSTLNEWDDLLNPYDYAHTRGKAEGERIGLETGWKEGLALGHVKALEIGIELGYMKALVRGILDETREKSEEKNREGDRRGNEVERKRVERMEGLLEAIDSFPGPDKMFAGAVSEAGALEDRTNVPSEDPSNEALATTGVNIVEELQRIRAKFTLFLKQSNLSHLSLKKVMDTGAMDEDGTTNGVENGVGGVPPMNEW